MTKKDKKLGKVKLKELPVIERHIKGKKKPRKIKRDYIYSGHKCPFCDLPLEKIDKTKDYWYFMPIENGLPCSQMISNVYKNCKLCGAFELIAGCPACHHSTWLKDGMYKHQKTHSNCGFVGKKK